MATYREMVYMVLDELKAKSDDFYYTEDHVIFLLDKYRAFLLKLKYSDIKKQIPQSNFLILKIPFTKKDYIPHILNICIPQLNSENNNSSLFNYCTENRFNYVGIEKYNKNSIYFTLKPYDDYLSLYSSKGGILYSTFPLIEIAGKTDIFSKNKIIEDIKTTDSIIEDIFIAYQRELNFLKAVFESPYKVYEFQNTEDIIDKRFPLEEGLISPLIEMVVKDLTTASLRPEDNINDSKDNLGDLNKFMYNNSKSDLQKQLYG